MWSRFKDSVPSPGTRFAVMWADGSGGYAYLMSDGNEILGAEDGMSEEVSRFKSDDLWSALPDDYALWFMEQHDDD